MRAYAAALFQSLARSGEPGPETGGVVPHENKRKNSKENRAKHTFTLF